MVETIVPVVHGARTWLASLTLFALAATASAACVGLLLGALLPAGGGRAAVAVALFALLEAAAELGLVRLPLPQVRRQVPQRWRERYPQPLAALLYGAGLGVGFATYLPVSTLLVVAAGVIALAGPGAGAAVLAAFGLGRGLALAVATARVRSYEQAAGRVERMSRLAGRRRLRRLNAAALALLAAVLALGAATGVARAATRLDLGPAPVADPSAAPGVLAFDRVNSDGSLTGVVRYNGTFTDLPGITPDVDGTRVVVDTGPGFEILDVTTMTVLQTLALSGRDPALSGNWLVYRRTHNGSRQIVLYDITDQTSRVIGHARLRSDLGPPDIAYPRVVYHRTSSTRSSLVVYRIDHASSRLLRTTVRYSYFNPSINGTRVVCVLQTLFGMSVRLIDLQTDHGTAIYTLKKRGGRFLWSTGISHRYRYFTVYDSAGSWIDRG